MAAIDFHALLSMAGVFALGVLSPGPNFMVVAQRAAARGRADGLATVLGVVAVSALWASSSLFGIGIVFRLFPWTRGVLRIIGATYLIWAGVRMWRSARVPLPQVEATSTQRGLGQAFRAGLSTNLSNAKAIAFYSSAFSAATPSAAHTATLWLALAVVLAIALLWYGLVALALSTGAMAAAYRRAKATIERTCGAVMIAFGAHLATSG